MDDFCLMKIAMKRNQLFNLINENCKKILYVIGPEGGITESEVEFLKKVGAVEVSLGKRILRAETAAIVLGGVIANSFFINK